MAQQTSTRPHVVYILADDMGWNDVGYMNKDNENVIESPNIDSLCQEGVRLDNYYVQSVCTPSRAVLMTGKYQIHTGMQHSIVQSGHPHALGVDHRTIAEEMRDVGYTTHMVGKWHLGYYKKEFQPLQRGFDTFYGFYNGAEYYFSHVGRCEFPGWDCAGPTSCWGWDFFNMTEPVYSTEYSTDLLTRRAEEIILQHNQDEKEEKPLFMYLPYQAVHGRLEAPQEVIDRFAHIQNQDRRTYAAMVWKLDEGVGNITRALKKAGIYNNTVIIFSSDNGGDPHFAGNNYPLRGTKGAYWEGGIRAIGFVHSPLLKEKGVIRRDLMHISDWFPTILRLAGVANDSEKMQGLDGVDQWDTINAGTPSPRTELLHTIDPLGLEDDPITGTQQAAIRQGPWKLLLGNPGQFIGHDGWILPPDYRPKKDKDKRQLSPPCSPCKFTNQNLTTGVCLFNIEEDPEERCNLAPVRQDLVTTLLARLEAYNATSVPARYPPPSNLCDPALSNHLFVAWGDVSREF